jgi:ribonuclease P protein component
LKRRFRLAKSSDFKRVRRLGKSYAHPLLVLIALPNGLDTSRFAVAAGRGVGKAVERNYAKRRMREGIRSLLPSIQPGWDILLLARKPISEASFQQIEAALQALFRRAQLLNRTDGERNLHGT